MLEGVFIKKNKTLYAVCMILGLSLIVLFAFIGIADSESTLRDILFGAVLGSFFVVAALVCLPFNHKAFLQINEKDGFIKGKFHWFGRIYCSFDRVAFVSAQVNVLTVLCKDGRRYTIMGLRNPFELEHFIRERIFAPEAEKPQILEERLRAEKTQRVNDLIRTIAGSVMIFVNIFVTAALTDWRELGDFTKADWTVFSLTLTFGLIILILTFFFAGRAGKRVLNITYLSYRARASHVFLDPLPVGRIIWIYTTLDYSKRLVAIRYHHSEKVMVYTQFIHEEAGIMYEDIEDFDSEEEVFEALREDIDLFDITDQTTKAE